MHPHHRISQGTTLIQIDIVLSSIAVLPPASVAGYTRRSLSCDQDFSWVYRPACVAATWPRWNFQ